MSNQARTMTHMDPGAYRTPTRRDVVQRPGVAGFGLRLAVALLAMAVGAAVFLLWHAITVK